MATVSAKNQYNKVSQDVPRLILQTALNLFTVRGFFNTSIHDIRKKADISIGSIYHYFKGKEAIAKALYNDLVETMNNDIGTIIAEHDTARESSYALIDYLFSMTDNSPTIIEYMLHAKHREFMPNEPPFCSSRPFAMIKAMVEKGMQRGEIRKMNPALASACLFGAALRLIHLRLDGALDEPLVPFLDEIWQCSWRSVAA